MEESSPSELNQLFLAAPGPSAERAWSKFVSRFSPLLLHAARTSASGYDDVMDAYAYILERLRENNFNRLHSYAVDPRTKFSTWLVLIARRLCIDRQRERYGRAIHGSGSPDDPRAARRRLVDLTAAEIDLDTLEDVVGTDPEHKARVRELSDLLHLAILELSPNDQLLLTLRFVNDLSAKEIAVIQSWPSAVHVYRRIDQLKTVLRARLEHRGVDGPLP